MTIGETAEPARLEWLMDAVACIRLTRGDSHNTLTMELLATLARLHGEAAAGGARALIVTGSGRSFCGGAHITYFTDPASPLYRNPRAIRDDYVAQVIKTFRALRESPFVTIAAINGHALGGGCELALSCDFRLISASARIGLTEARLGAVPGGGGLQLISRVVGPAKALEIALLGDQWSAQDALAAGLVTSVHDPESLEQAALAFARRVLLCSPVSIAETKRALYRCATAGAEEADAIALDAVAAAAAGPDWWEGMAAFIAKRPAAFKVEAS